MGIYLSLPKVNLHQHLEGSIRPKTFFELAGRYGLEAPVTSIEESEKFLQISSSDVNLSDFLVKVDRSLAVSQFPGALTRMAFEAVEDGFTQNVKYLELRFGPRLHMEKGRTVEESILEVLAGLELAMEKYPITAKLIVCGLRQHSEMENLELALIAAKYRRKGLVGFDIAGDEMRNPNSIFREAFTRAKANGLGITVHAGEVGLGDGVVDAIKLLHADRIGHGIQIASKPNLIEKVRQSGVTLEICPTSNVDTGAVPTLEKHPIRRLFDAGIPISLGDDDPTTSNINITSEYRLIAKEFSFTPKELATIVLAGAKAAFLPERDKGRLMAELEKRLAEWLRVNSIS